MTSVRLMAAVLLLWLGFNHGDSSVRGNLAVGAPPAHILVNGERWDIWPAAHDDGDFDAWTICGAKEIRYSPEISPTYLREKIVHEVFHAGACSHGGDEWWNSVKPTDSYHPGIYHLASFTTEFALANPEFMAWLEDKKGAK